MRKRLIASQGHQATGRKAPQRIFPFTRQFTDHADREYTVVHTAATANVTLPRLGIQVYCLGQFESVEGLAQGLLHGVAHQAFDRATRCDVFTGFRDVEACIEHHRKEKTFRKDAMENMRRQEVDGLGEDDVHEKLVDEVRGRQPLPHIVPTWCRSAPFWREGDIGDRYRSWILVIPEDRKSWEDIVDKGLLYVQFDLEVTQDMIVLIHDCEPEDDQILENDPEGYVDVEKSTYGECPPVDVKLVCVRDPPPERFFWASDNISQEDKGQDDWRTPNSQERLVDTWRRVSGIFRDCSYRSADCQYCERGEAHENCERDLDEHFLDEDGQCVACRRAKEYRRRSKRIAARLTVGSK